MAGKLKTGTILFKEGTLLPECSQLESEPYSKGWRLVRNLGGSEMDRELSKEGWTFFYMADEVNATAFGSSLEATTRRAVGKLTARMKSDRLNCLEITRIAANRFLGLPYLTVSAHRRHIQESMFLFQCKVPAESDQVKLAAA